MITFEDLLHIVWVHYKYLKNKQAKILKPDYYIDPFDQLLKDIKTIYPKLLKYIQ